MSLSFHVAEAGSSVPGLGLGLCVLCLKSVFILIDSWQPCWQVGGGGDTHCHGLPQYAALLMILGKTQLWHGILSLQMRTVLSSVFYV